MRAIIDDLPELYRNLLPPLFTTPAPAEVFSTCANCCMTAATIPPERRFSAGTKCCTYHPWLPNYMVGAILVSEPPASEGRRRIERTLQNRQGVFPSGVHAPRLYHALYDRGQQRAFGKSSTLLCPFFNTSGGTCTIWKYRDAVCSTYFCKTMTGKAGVAFWQSMNAYLTQVQRQLSTHCLFQLHAERAVEIIGRTLSTDYMHGPLLPDDLDGAVSDTDYSRAWTAWEGREADFFSECYRTVAGLSGAQFEAIGGIDERLRRNQLTGTFAAMSTISDYLTVGHAERKISADGRHYLLVIKELEVVVRMPVAVLDIFNGRTSTREAIRLSQANHNFPLTAEMLLTAIHAGFLRPGTPPLEPPVASGSPLGHQPDEADELHQ